MTSPGLPRVGRDGLQARRASRHARAEQDEDHEGDHHDGGDEALAAEEPLVRLDLVLLVLPSSAGPRRRDRPGLSSRVMSMSGCATAGLYCFCSYGTILISSSMLKKSFCWPSAAETPRGKKRTFSPKETGML